MVKEYCGEEMALYLRDEENENEDDIDMIEAAFGIDNGDGGSSDMELD